MSETTGADGTVRQWSRRSLALLLASVLLASSPAPNAERHFLYLASPGTRNYVEYGGVGLLVLDIDDGCRFVRRIPTWSMPEGKPAANVRRRCRSWTLVDGA